MYTPVNPSFTLQKSGSRGSKLYKYVFVMSKSKNVLRLIHCIKYQGYNIRFTKFAKIVVLG